MTMKFSVKRRGAGWMLALLLLGLASTAVAQTVDKRTISLDGALKAIAAAGEEARRNNWSVVIAVVDEAGELVALQRMDKVQRASIDIAVGKARAAMLFLRPSAALEEAAKARTNLLSVASDVPRVVFVQGGLPLVVGKDQVGAIGVSGLTSPQDEQVAKAGADAIK